LRRLVVRSDFGALVEGEIDKAPEHQPFAAVLSCSDARVPTELLFLEPLNELFVVRLAGNVVSNESLGSLDFAARNLGGSVKLMVVLGHTGCGAVDAAVSAYLDPAHTAPMTDSLGLRSVVEHLFIAVRTAARALGDRGVPASDDVAYRSRLAAVSVVVNAAISAMTLRRVLGTSALSGCGVVFGVYDLATRRVMDPEKPGLADPPSTLEELAALAAQVAGTRSE
jgi:carbonic anhydrase